MNWKAFLGGLGVVAAVAGFFLLATPPRAETESLLQPPTVDWEAVHDDPDHRLRISLLVNNSGREGTWVQRQMEERFNVEFDLTFLPAAAHTYRKPLMLAGGKVPDVFIDPDPIEVQRDAYHGFLLEVPHRIILRHAPNYVAAVNSVEPIGWLYSHWRGRNYGVPTVYVSLLLSVPGVWRGDWLKAVGLHDPADPSKPRVPETLDQMHEALRRFRHNDPDGNGRQDTYGMSGDVTNWWWASFADVFGAYGVTPFDWMERDGRCVWGGLLPEARQALATLRAWYGEGLIHPDFVTDKSRESLHRKFLNGRTGYLYYDGKHHEFDLTIPTSLASKMRQLQPSAELVCGRFPIGPGGRRGGRVWSGGHVIVFGKHLAAEPAKVLRVLRILDTVVTDEELYIASKYGQRGVHWTWRDADLGPGGGIRQLPPYTDRNQQFRALLGEMEGGAILSPCGPKALLDKYTRREELAFNNEHRRGEWALKDVLGKPDVVPSAAVKLRDVRQFQMTVYAEIIRGDRPLEDFAWFAREWLRRGGQQMTDEATELLRAKKRVYRQVGVTE